MKKFSLVIAALLTCALTAYADSLVTVRPVGTDSVDWSNYGYIPYSSGGIELPNPFNFTTTNGVSGSGSFAYPQYSWGGDGGEVTTGGFSSWLIGEYNYVVSTDSTGPLTLSFDQGYTQIGAQISSWMGGPFNAQICDVNGCFNENGYTALWWQQSTPAIYIGIESSTPITWVTFSLTSATWNPNQFVISDVTLDATPEPSSLLLLGTGLMGLVGGLRRKFAC